MVQNHTVISKTKLVDVTTTMSLTAPACDSSEIEACTGNCFCVNTCTNECNYFVAPNSFGNYGSMPKPECSGAPDCTVGNPPCK